MAKGGRFEIAVVLFRFQQMVFQPFCKSFVRNFVKYLMQKSRLSWFSGLALDQDLPLHVASGWNYLSESEYNEIIDQVTNQITIEENDSVFELGQSFQISFKCFGHNQCSIFILVF